MKPADQDPYCFSFDIHNEYMSIVKFCLWTGWKSEVDMQSQLKKSSMYAYNGIY